MKDIKLLDEEMRVLYEEEDRKIEEAVQILPVWADRMSTQYGMEFNVNIPDKSIIVFLADWHVGSRYTEYEKLSLMIDDINRYENVYVLILGDLIDNFNVKVSSLGNQALIPLMKQKQIVEYYVEKLADKCIGMAQGNHEERSVITDDYDFTEYMARKFKVNYLGFVGMLNIDLGLTDKKLRILAGHKYKGYSMYNPVHQCIRAKREIDPTADVVVYAHQHVKAMLFVNNQYYIQCGTYQRTSRWAQSVGYDPRNEIGANAIFINNGKIIPYQNAEDALEIHGVLKDEED